MVLECCRWMIHGWSFLVWQLKDFERWCLHDFVEAHPPQNCPAHRKLSINLLKAESKQLEALAESEARHWKLFVPGAVVGLTGVRKLVGFLVCRRCFLRPLRMMPWLRRNRLCQKRKRTAE